MVVPDDRIPPHAWRVLAILMVFYLFSFLDKQMYALLINEIGENLGLPDFALGTIQGVAFSGFYIAGVFVAGILVDKYSRRMILLAGVVFWSLAAAASGLANSFGELFAARAGVGLGEAVLIPAALAMLASTFPRNKLSLATGLFMAGANIGGVVALLAGGAIIAELVDLGPTVWPVLGRLEAWQGAFVITGLPGVIIALLAFGLPRQPAGGSPGAHGGHGRGGASQVAVLDYVRGHKAFLAGVMLSISFLTMLAYTLIIWAPAFFERQFGWGHERIGIVLAIGIGVGGIGNVFWGWVADRIRATGRKDALFLLYITLTLLGLPLAGVVFTTSDPTIASVAYPLMCFTINSFGPMATAMQLAIPDSLRGRLQGMSTMLTGLVGLASGPMLVSAITDFVFGDRAMIGYSMLIAIILAAGLAVLAMAASRRAYVAAILEREADIAAAQDRVQAQPAPPSVKGRQVGAAPLAPAT